MISKKVTTCTNKFKISIKEMLLLAGVMNKQCPKNDLVAQYVDSLEPLYGRFPQNPNHHC